jgi:hypothetical protein
MLKKGDRKESLKHLKKELKEGVKEIKEGVKGSNLQNSISAENVCGLIFILNLD